MADETDDIVVNIDDETDKKPAQDSAERARDDKGRFAAADDGDKGKQEQADPAIAELRRQYEELQAKDAERDRRAREAADAAAAARREAEAARKEAETARGEVVDSQLGTVTSGIAAAESEAAAAEAAYAAAMEAGNFAEAAKQQRRTARAEAEAVRLAEAKDDIERRKAEPKPEKTEARPAKDDPMESFLKQFTAPTANWLREHPEWVTDQRKNAKLTAAHYDALEDGLAADSPEYFERVETLIGLRQEQKANGKANGKTPPKRQSAPVAPVGRVNGESNGLGGTEVRLSKAEAAAATDGTLVWNYDDSSPQKRFKKGDPIGVEEFARRKLKMKESGLYDRTYTEA